MRHLILFAALAAVPAFALEVPFGWGGGGYRHEGYDWGIDAAVQHGGKPALVVRSGADSADKGEANMGSAFRAERYVGKRLRYSAYVKTSEVSSWAGLWMGVYGSQGVTSLVFDNMRGRPLKGTSDWARYDIVLDVPAGAEKINIGFHLVGKGQVWFASPTVEEVSTSVQVTVGHVGAWDLPAEPQLDLSKRAQGMCAVTPRPDAPAMTPSPRGGTRYAMMFRNNCAGTRVTLDWVDFDGKPSSRGELNAGETMEQTTFVGHQWRVREASSGKWIRDFALEGSSVTDLCACP